MSIVIIATVIAKEGKTEYLKAELSKLVEPTLAENGNLVYQMHQDLENPNKFVVVEEWVSNQVIPAHLSTAHIKQYTDNTKENDAIESFEYVTLKKF